jgi:hypothetical protein
MTDTPTAASTIERLQPGYSGPAEERYRKAVGIAEKQKAAL